MKIAILYSNYLNEITKTRKIGGVETYIYHLARLCTDIGHNTRIFQWSNSSFNVEKSGIPVIGVPVTKLGYRKRPKALFNMVITELFPEVDIIIFGSDQQSIRCDNKRTISIQHGVGWDLPSKYLTSHRIFHKGLFGTIYKIWLQRKFVRTFERCANRVCVDHNYINWYRTQIPEDSMKRTWVIPNFTTIASEELIRNRARSDKAVRILFARRFQKFRGTRLFAESATYILSKYPHVMITLAGEGPDEDWLKAHFVGQERVTFEKYSLDESLSIHLGHDIAVVPSLACEGTSLSVAEAMGAGCAVIGTAVGGITNMVIDGYNGLLVSPNASELSLALVRLIESPELRKELGGNAYMVAQKGFSLSGWQVRWRAVIETMTEME